MTIATTPEERMALIRKTAEKFNKKVKRNRRVLKDETPVFDRSGDDNNINHWTDAKSYANEYYGEVFRATTKFDNDWN